MQTIKFILQKIIIIEVMLIVLLFATNLFEISIPILDTILNTSLTYLTPISIISLVLYIILSLLSLKIVEIAIGVVLGGLILYYIFNLR